MPELPAVIQLNLSPSAAGMLKVISTIGLKVMGAWGEEGREEAYAVAPLLAEHMKSSPEIVAAYEELKAQMNVLADLPIFESL